MVLLSFALLLLLSSCLYAGERFIENDVDVQQLASTVAQLQQELRTLKAAGTGSTYVRWGRKTCPTNGTSLVYTGYVAGSHYTHVGAAANYLCLPPNPDWDQYNDALQNGALIYGGEYEFTLHSIPKFFKSGIVTNDDPACAVCTTSRSRVLMIPGKNQCPQGWTKEYSGYLAAGDYAHTAASEYVCLDKSPEAIIGGRADHNGKLFYLVEGRCGSLECPPYVNGRELTCAVCTM